MGGQFLPSFFAVVPVRSSPAAPTRDRPRKFWRRWTPPLPDPEDSIALRGLVQALVTVGIAAVVVASYGVAPASLFNLLAIPLSALGGYWSWRQRQRSNIAVKFLIAFGMLMALGFFLARLLGEGSDTRIRLAELLIHLLVFHSFDMPRRKDLGYSIVIGLILLGVAATVSQTFTLAPLLLLFLAIALPVLVLDYRSRLDLRPTSQEQGRWVLPPRRMGGVLLVTVVLGLGIFTVFPRLPGYQIRNFPVSATVNFQGDFSGEAILNPGYTNGDGTALENAGGDSDIQGRGTLEGAGQLDDTFYYGFNRRMNQNLRGSLTPKVLMRVRSQAEGFWRVLAFDRYTGQGWEISRQEEVQVLDRSRLSYQVFLPESAYQIGLVESYQGRRQEVIQTYTVVNPLPNLLPALYQARELYFPTRQVAIDTEGALRAPIGLAPGLTYTVISQVPYRDRTALGQAGTEYSQKTRDLYLQMPDALRDRLRQETEAALATSPQPLRDPYEQTLYLAQYLKQNYTIQPELPFFEEGEDLAEAFLFTYGGGYPDHFPTVLTLMLRSIGIPARLVAGFAPGEFNPFTGYYVVRNTDAYAMTEVFFPGFGWFPFDPIPGREVIPPSIRDSQTFSVLRRFWSWVASWLPAPVASGFNDLFTAIATLLARLFQLFSQGWLGAIAALLIGTAIAFIGWLSWLGGRRWFRRWQLRQLPPVEQTYQELLLWLTAQGWPRRPSQTPWEHLQQLLPQIPPPQGSGVTAIVQAYMRWRYGEQPQDVDTLKQQLRSLKKRRSP